MLSGSCVHKKGLFLARARHAFGRKLKYLLFSEINMGVEDRIISLDRETKGQVRDTLQSINLALKLNSAKLKQKKVPKKLAGLMLWKNALEKWHIQYGETSELIEMAEGLGAFQELCLKLGQGA